MTTYNENDGISAQGASRLRLLFGEDALRKIAAARVAVVGVGGVGGWCAEALARSGVGRLTLIDDDVVAASNLNRQVTAARDAIGRPKVDVLRERLRAINPALEIDAYAARYTPETAERFGLAFCRCVVDAIDSVADKAHLVRHVLDRTDAALFSSMGAGGRRDPGLVRATRFEKVAGDALARALRRRFRRDGLFPSRSFTCVWSPEPCVNRGERRAEDGRANGSFMPVTAAFGLRLAALAVERLLAE